MVGEYETASVFQALGLWGVSIYAGTTALFLKRVIGGGSLVYFAGNTVAAALVLASNFGGVEPGALLAQIALIAAGLMAMILAFPRGSDAA